MLTCPCRSDASEGHGLTQIVVAWPRLSWSKNDISKWLGAVWARFRCLHCLIKTWLIFAVILYVMCILNFFCHGYVFIIMSMILLLTPYYVYIAHMYQPSAWLGRHIIWQQSSSWLGKSSLKCRIMQEWDRKTHYTIIYRATTIPASSLVLLLCCQHFGAPFRGGLCHFSVSSRHSVLFYISCPVFQRLTLL